MALALVATAQAETISVPCGEYVQATGEPIPCQAIPAINIDRAAYEAKKVAQAGGEATPENAPWAKAEAEPKAGEPGVENCDMPPWMRPDNCPAN